MTSKVEYKLILNSSIYSKIWKNEKGDRYRDDGPAIEYADGTKIWYKNVTYHREDGPAIVWYDGRHSYYLNDQRYSKEEYWEEIEKIKKTKEENKNDSKN